MSPQQLPSALLPFLDRWRSLPELAQLSQLPSVVVSEELQLLDDAGLLETAEGGHWRARSRLCAGGAAASEAPAPDLVVLVDLGNVHDCLQKMLPLASAGELRLLAYADLQYNGFGVNPPLAARGCTVFRAESPQKNAADTQLVWDCAQLCSRAQRPLRLLVATKDNGFRHLKALAEAAGHRLDFAQDWASLRALLLLLAPPA